MRFFSQTLLCLPLAFLFIGKATTRISKGMADFSGRQDSIQKVCRGIDKDWPDCKMVFSTYLLEPDYGPLVGKTNCDNSCIFTSGVACASKVAMCVNPCTSNPASSQCIQCVSNIGLCPSRSASRMPVIAW